jgi:hypothetical protein
MRKMLVLLYLISISSFFSITFGQCSDIAEPNNHMEESFQVLFNSIYNLQSCVNDPDYYSFGELMEVNHVLLILKFTAECKYGIKIRYYFHIEANNRLRIQITIELRCNPNPNWKQCH